MSNLERSNRLRSFSEFQTEASLAHQLPYWDFLDQEKGNCVVLADGSLVQGLQLTGLSIETYDADTLNLLATQLRSLLNSLPDGSEVQFFHQMNSNVNEVLSKHSALQEGNPLVQWLSQSRIESLKQKAATAYLLKSNLYLFVYKRIEKTEGTLRSFFSKPSVFAQVRKEEHEVRVKELSQLVASIQSNLSTVGISSSTLESKTVWETAYTYLNPNRSQMLSAPEMNKEHRDLEFTQAELAKEPKLAHSSPREQMIFSNIIQSVDSFFLDGFYHRHITLKTLPEYTHSALVQRLLDLPFHYDLSMQIQVPEQSKELSSLQAKRRMAHSMSMGQAGRVSDLESEAKLHSTEELLRELMNTSQKVFYFQMSILLREKEKDDLEVKTKQVLSRFRELNGAEGLEEGVAGLKVFKTSLPAGNVAMIRSKRIKTDNLADFLPVYQGFEGTSRPVCVFENRRSGLFGYDPFDATLPNYNSLVTGSSGAGKSFLNNCIMLQYLSQKPLVYVIDIGGSYRKLCEFFGGQYLEISAQKDGSWSKTINPFLLPKGAKEPSPEKIKFLIALLETIFTDEEGDKLPKLDKSMLEEAIIETYTKFLPNRVPRLSDLKAMLESKGDESLRNFAKMLYPWTGNRPYGRLLDADSSFDLDAEFVVFDLKGLSSHPDLQAAMLLITTDFILGKVEGVPDRIKQIYMDECWQLLKKHGASVFMEYCVRTLRKMRSGITFITQGLEEIERSAIGSAILNNTATKFILMQRGDLEPIRKTLKLNSQEMSLISSLRQEKGRYSEAFLVANEARGVVRVVPTPIEYWLASSDGADNELLANARKRFPEKSLPEIIHYLATHYPKGSQGVTQLEKVV